MKADDYYDTISMQREQNRESYDYKKVFLKEEEDTEAERKKLFEYLKEVESQNQEEGRKVQIENVEEMRRRDIRIKELEVRLKEYRDEPIVSLGDELLSVREIEILKKEKFLKKLEKDLETKENEIRNQLFSEPGVEEEVEEEEEAESKEKDKDEKSRSGVTHLLKPYVGGFSGDEPVPKNESSFEEWSASVSDRLKGIS